MIFIANIDPVDAVESATYSRASFMMKKLMRPVFMVLILVSLGGLALDQIDKVVKYLRALCPEPHWPLGELNFPRAMATEKAFPEDEAVLTTAINTKGLGGVESELSYEKRFGVKNQLEFAFPFSFVQRDNNSWVGGLGDFFLGYKRTVVSSIGSGSIFSLQGGIAFPTGNRLRGLGSGVTTFETFAAFGQRLPGKSFIQVQAGAELPTDTKK